jgi:hypothetical protein
MAQMDSKFSQMEHALGQMSRFFDHSPIQRRAEEREAHE